MAVLELHSGRQFFESRAPLPAMVNVGGSADASELARRWGVEPDQTIAAFIKSLRDGIAAGGAPVFLAGAVLTATGLRWLAREKPMQTVPLNQIADFRAGFEVAEIVLWHGGEVRWPG